MLNFLNINFMLEKTKSSLLRFQKLMSYVAVTLGSFITVVMIPAIFQSHSRDVPVMLASGVALGILPLTIGIMSINRVNKKIKKEIDDFNEKVVLSTAKSKFGNMTATELSEIINLNLEESNKLLEQFVIRGIASADVNSNGIIVYKFPEYLSE